MCKFRWVSLSHFWKPKKYEYKIQKSKLDYLIMFVFSTTKQKGKANTSYTLSKRKNGSNNPKFTCFKQLQNQPSKQKQIKIIFKIQTSMNFAKPKTRKKKCGHVDSDCIVNLQQITLKISKLKRSENQPQN
jgi:hypothetical protein